MVSNYLAIAFLCNFFCIFMVLCLVVQNHFQCAKTVPSSLILEHCVPCNNAETV